MYLNDKKNDKYMYNWLICMFILVACIIVIGGLTRLTDSGLSITKWELFSGTFPPLNNEKWINYFEEYKKIPEFKIQNYLMTLGEFKIIFWWEWCNHVCCVNIWLLRIYRD